jgi:hypothetical protein
MKFSVKNIRFTASAGDDDDEARDLPKPLLLKLQRRLAAGVREAREPCNISRKKARACTPF